MRRLYLQIYLSLVTILVLFSVLASVAWFVPGSFKQEEWLHDAAGRVVGRRNALTDNPLR